MGMIRSNFIVVCAIFFLLLGAGRARADHAVNINTADKATLTTLTGIGDAKAQAIIDYRAEHGPYASKEDIMNVSGIGSATYENIKDHITVGSTSSQSSQTIQTTAETSSSETTESTQEKTQGTSKYSTSDTFQVDAGGNRTVIVGADTLFKAIARDAGGRTVEAQYKWNFGDGTSMDGRDITHRFEYPGRYAVVLEVVSRQGARATEQITVSVESLQVAFKTLSDGGVVIENLATRDIDLSEWQVAQYPFAFKLPQNTVILRGGSIRLSSTKLGFRSTIATVLSYPDGRVALKASSGEILMNAGESDSSTVSTSKTPSTSRASARSYAEENTESAEQPSSQSSSSKSVSVHEEVLNNSSSSPQVAAATAALVSGGSTSLLLWGGALAIVGLGALAVFATRRSRSKGYKGWTIIEDEE